MQSNAHTDENVSTEYRPTTFDLLEDRGKTILYVHTGEVGFQLELEGDDLDRLRSCLENPPTPVTHDEEPR
jgi:hypothetical protein